MSFKRILLVMLAGIALAFAVFGFAVYVTGGPVYNADSSNTIQHREILYPANARPLDLQCGDKPCVVFYDPDKGAVVALMIDGSTVTVKPEETSD